MEIAKVNYLSANLRGYVPQESQNHSDLFFQFVKNAVQKNSRAWSDVRPCCAKNWILILLFFSPSAPTTKSIKPYHFRISCTFSNNLLVRMQILCSLYPYRQFAEHISVSAYPYGITARAYVFKQYLSIFKTV